MIDSIGVPKHSDFEPDYFLAKGDGNLPENGGIASETKVFFDTIEQKR